MRFTVKVDPDALPIVKPRTLAEVTGVARGLLRVDVQNPEEPELAQALGEAWLLVWPKLRGRMRGFQVRSKTMAFVEPGAPAQPWHCDLDGDLKYHTVIVPLTTEHDAGGTQFEDGAAQLPVRGSAYCFNGAEVHRGAAHAGKHQRIFATFVVTPLDHEVKDLNVFT